MTTCREMSGLWLLLRQWQWCWSWWPWRCWQIMAPWTQNSLYGKSVLCNTIVPTTPSYDHKCYYSVNFLEEETEAQKDETIYSRHEAGEVVETCAANREKHGPEQQRKLPLANHSLLAQQEVAFQRLLYQRQKPLLLPGHRLDAKKAARHGDG